MRIMCFLMFCVSACFAETALKFESFENRVLAPADAKVVTARFAFTNPTDKLIKITKMDAPCSCLKARLVPGRLLKDGIAPGESGVVEGSFEIGSFKGVVTKSIALWSDEGRKEPSIHLRTTVEIPILFDIQPKTLTWDLGGGELTPQSFQINVKHSEPINIVSHKITSDQFAYEIKTLEAGKKYEVVVTPATLDEPGLGILSFVTDCKIAKQKRQQAFVVVRKKRE